MQKLFFIIVFTMFMIQGCGQEEMKLDDNKLIGLSEETVSKMYVGHILPASGFEYHTADKEQMNRAIVNAGINLTH
ncbi:hypothetical protein [Brevibacillus migulae]|uniref:hypothetical protein n=1 Tax=Brevibacillus migulae TaxID=1644114 RepID=UPI00106E5C02|nr:hypothetical protein [Brevibacillus migulae]